MNNKEQKERLKKVYHSLTPEQQQILVNKQINGRYTTTKWLKLMNKLALFDEYGDGLVQSISKKRNWFIFFAILSFILAIASNGLYPIVPMLVIFCSTITFIVFIIKFVKEIRHFKKSDLDNSFRELVVPLVGVFKEEIKEGSKLNLKVDARNPMDKIFYTDTLKKSSFYGRTYLNYFCPWLEGDVVFVDDSHLAFNVVKKCQKVKITKQSRSGKTKYKTKIKMKEVNQFKLVLPKKRYQLQEGGNPNIRKEEQGEHIVLKAKYTRKSGAIDTTRLSEFLNMIHQMYSLVKPIS